MKKKIIISFDGSTENIDMDLNQSSLELFSNTDLTPRINADTISNDDRHISKTVSWEEIDNILSV